MRLPLLCLMLAAAMPPAGAVSIPACDGSALCGFSDPPLIRLDTLLAATLPPPLLPVVNAQDQGEPSALGALFCTLLSSPSGCAPPLQLVDSSSSSAPAADSSLSFIGTCPKACVEQLRQGS